MRTSHDASRQRLTVFGVVVTAMLGLCGCSTSTTARSSTSHQVASTQPADIHSLSSSANQSLIISPTSPSAQISTNGPSVVGNAPATPTSQSRASGSTTSATKKPVTRPSDYGALLITGTSDDSHLDFVIGSKQFSFPITPSDDGAIYAMAAPLGTPTSGSIYVVIPEPAQVYRLKPDGSHESIDVQDLTGFGTLTSGYGPEIAIAPANTPEAGTAFINSNHGILVVSPDGKTTVLTLPDSTDQAVGVAVAGAGAVNAGDLYVIGQTAVYRSDSSLKDLRVIATGTLYPNDMRVAPSGAPNEGTIYVSGDPVLKIDPEDKPEKLGVSGNLLAMAPEGTPNAGTLFVLGDSVSLVKPSGDVISTPGSANPSTFRIAPEGTAAAGTAYFCDDDGTATQLSLSGKATAFVPGVKFNGLGPIIPVDQPNAGWIFTQTSDGKTSLRSPTGASGSVFGAGVAVIAIVGQ